MHADAIRENPRESPSNRLFGSAPKSMFEGEGFPPFSIETPRT
jgi:hypothetical protein